LQVPVSRRVVAKYFRSAAHSLGLRDLEPVPVDRLVHIGALLQINHECR
jgi:hypothetical protein